MPEFIIEVTYSSTYIEFRCADDTRHAKKILAGLRGRYRNAGLRVHRIGTTEDVTADFAKGA